MKRWTKWIVTTVIVAALLGALANAFLPKPIMVDMASVAKGDLQVSIEEDGKTRVKDRYVVKAPLAGRLRRIKFRPGDRVNSGQVLAIIDPSDPQLLDPRTIAQSEARVKSLKAGLDKAGAELRAAEAAFDLAETEYSRVRQLSQTNSVSASERESKASIKRTREEEVRKARFAEEMAKFELEQAKAALLRTRPRTGAPDEDEQFDVTSPQLSSSGRVFHVLRIHEENESVVTAGAPLIEMGDLADLEIEIEVLSSDAVKIPTGAKVLLEQWGGEGPLAAKVRLVEPYAYTKISALGVEEQRLHVIADFSEESKIPETLGDGYRVEAKIIVWERGDVLVVPTSALFRLGQNWAVFVVERGKDSWGLSVQKAIRREVQIGKKSPLSAEVLGGLSESDLVVVHPSDKVADGAIVAPR